MAGVPSACIRRGDISDLSIGSNSGLSSLLLVPFPYVASPHAQPYSKIIDLKLHRCEFTCAGQAACSEAESTAGGGAGGHSGGTYRRGN